MQTWGSDQGLRRAPRPAWSATLRRMTTTHAPSPYNALPDEQTLADTVVVLEELFSSASYFRRGTMATTDRVEADALTELGIHGRPHFSQGPRDLGH
jgi:hypothetical protein